MQHTYDIVMVDDDSDDLDFMSDAFQSIGKQKNFGVFQSSNELMDYLQTVHQQDQYPSVVLLDHNLAGESGKEIIFKLKKQGIEKKMTFVIFSNYISAAQQEQLKEIGVVNCLTKPTTFEKYVQVADYLSGIADTYHA